jgi:hypothetical protein
VEPIQAPRAAGVLGHQPGLLQDAQVLRNGRAADRELLGDLAHRALAGAEQLHDRASVRIA